MTSPTSAPAILIRQRLEAPKRVLLGGHMDTVFGADSPFQATERIEGGAKLRGPGVADMKGGLVVLWAALTAVEKSPYAEHLGWDLLITGDEEIGSIASAPLWKQYAWQNHYALLFEPAPADGSLIATRKGSITYAVDSYGRAAHAGRDFHVGVNAAAAMAHFAVAADALNGGHRSGDLTVNIGTLASGSAANIVPNKAHSLVNLRASTLSQLLDAERHLHEAALQIEQATGATFTFSCRGRRPPKEGSTAVDYLLGAAARAATYVGIPLTTTSTGGVCDGNTVAAEGIATLDNMGAVGGGLHTDDEWIWNDSLVERAQLTALVLCELAQESQK